MGEKNTDRGSRKKKFFVRSFFVLFVLAVISYFVANFVLNGVTHQAMLQLAVEAGKQGTEVTQPSFESVGLNGFLGATWSGLRAKLQRVNDDSNRTGRFWEVQVERMAVDWDLDGQATLDIQGMTFVGRQPRKEKIATKLLERRIELKQMSCEFPLDLFDPKAAVKLLLTSFLQLWEDGAIEMPLDIEGKIVFTLKGQPCEMRMQTVEQEGITTVVFLREDVARLSDVFDDKLTAAEVDLIASQARHAPRLLEIKDDAKTISATANQKDPSVPQDAYRHVLWSFMLTKEFDAEFAKQVGDAHESGDTGNTEAEREMDLQNNAVGRRYAQEGITRREVLARVMNAAEVRREP